MVWPDSSFSISPGRSFRQGVPFVLRCTPCGVQYTKPLLSMWVTGRAQLRSMSHVSFSVTGVLATLPRRGLRLPRLPRFRAADDRERRLPRLLRFFDATGRVSHDPCRRRKTSKSGVRALYLRERRDARRDDRLLHGLASES